MRKVVCTQLGEPRAALSVVEEDDPAPGPGQAVVAVGAAGVAFVDGLMVLGGYQIKPPLPFTPGSEVAGTVVAVGEGVDEALVGARVWATTLLGGWASHVVLPALALHRVPDRLSLPAAGSFGVASLTMLRALQKAEAQPGERVVQLGAGGGLGLAGCALAAAMGCEVVAVASSEEKRAAALAAGATHVVDSATEDVKARIKELTGGADVVLDPVGGDLTEVGLRALGFRGRLVVLGFVAGIPRLPTNLVLLNDRSVLGVEYGGWAARRPDDNARLLADLTALVEGGLHVPEPTTAPLAEVASLVEAIHARRLTGRAAVLP